MAINFNNGLPLSAPKVTPVLDPWFRPAVLACREYQRRVRESGTSGLITVGLEQSDGTISRFSAEVFPQNSPEAVGNFTYIERILKLLLWSRGGWRIHFSGPQSLAHALAAYYRDNPCGKFDSHLVGERMFDRAIEVVRTESVPAERSGTTALGRHLDGCRIGFDLGGSDRKCAAVIDGKVVFSDETVWDPYFQKDPQYHFDGIMDSLKKAAAHLPRVDAIGGSAAGIYLKNRVKVASLFRGVPAPLFETRVKDLFFEIQKAWGGVPLEVVNDGEVTALAGSMSLKLNRILGISLGTSTAGGYVNGEGNITTWLNEFAFVPVDYNPSAPVDEWSGDRGCGVQYLSQQCVARLLEPAGIELEAKLSFAEKLKQVQKLMDHGDYRAAKIYQTIGVYLGYTIAHLADFYDLDNVLILGRVTSGAGGDLILKYAREVLGVEFPDLDKKISFHIPDEKDKRHGQAIAAASLPKLTKV
ncbi:MAG TPA: ROK family protein [Verrucomicrobiae bacterium]|nr:ROK family protein [Verrucomicrobiae bacterium]